MAGATPNAAGASGNLAKTTNTLIKPSDLAERSALIGSAMTALDRTRSGPARGDPNLRV